MPLMVMTYTLHQKKMASKCGVVSYLDGYGTNEKVQSDIALVTPILGNSLYTIIDGPSWTEAEANAVKLGGHLVKINDASEITSSSIIILKVILYSVLVSLS